MAFHHFMKHPLLKILSFAFLLISITPVYGQVEEEREDALLAIQERGNLRVAVYRDHPPFSFNQGGKLTGLDVELGELLAAELGVFFSPMVVNASDEAMNDDLRNNVWRGHYLGGGVADVMLHIPVDARFAEKNRQVAIFGPYLTQQIVILRDTEAVPQVTNWSTAEPVKIGVEMASIGSQFFLRFENGRLANQVRHFRTVDAMCDAIHEGFLQLLVLTEGQAIYCARQAKRMVIDTFPDPKPALFQWPIGLAVKTDRPELKTALEEIIQRLDNSGKLTELRQSYGFR